MPFKRYRVQWRDKAGTRNSGTFTVEDTSSTAGKSMMVRTVAVQSEAVETQLALGSRRFTGDFDDDAEVVSAVRSFLVGSVAGPKPESIAISEG